MKESYEEDLANHSAANPTLTRGNSVGVAWVSGTHRPTIELRYHIIVRMPTHSCLGEGHTVVGDMASPTPIRRSLRTCACVETPDARTGRAYQLPAPTRGCHGGGNDQ